MHPSLHGVSQIATQISTGPTGQPQFGLLALVVICPMSPLIVTDGPHPTHPQKSRTACATMTMVTLDCTDIRVNTPRPAQDILGELQLSDITNLALP